jgi:uncharacterized protein (DUF697 family)
MSIGPLGARALFSAVREAGSGARDRRPLVVAGARELVPLLARALREGGDASAVQEGGPVRSAAALVWVGAPDEVVLREAAGARVPIVGVTDGESLPYVLDTWLVVAGRGAGLPVAELVRALAGALGEGGTGLAARLPVLRSAVIDVLIRLAARRNGLVGAAVFVPGVDLPVLTLNQVRLVVRIAGASGREVDRALLPEVLAVVGSGFGLRAVARELLDVVPVAGWAAKGAVAYAGTRAIGEAARLRFAATR